jgi:hypothetical protein
VAAGRTSGADPAAHLALFVSPAAVPGQDPGSDEAALGLGWDVLAECWAEAVAVSREAIEAARHVLAGLSDEERGHLVVDIAPGAGASPEPYALRALVAAALG